MRRGFTISYRYAGETVLEFAKRILEYRPETGEFLWKESRNGRALAGSRAGHVNAEGYIAIRVEGQLFLAHRLAMWFFFGEQSLMEVDHKNRIRSDNRIENLRWATDLMNVHNAGGPTSRNTSGFRGVSKEGCRYRAMCKARGITYSLGTFSTPEEASEAYERARKDLHTGVEHEN